MWSGDVRGEAKGGVARAEQGLKKPNGGKERCRPRANERASEKPRTYIRYSPGVTVCYKELGRQSSTLLQDRPPR